MHLRFDDALRAAVTRNLALRAATPLKARGLKRVAHLEQPVWAWR